MLNEDVSREALNSGKQMLQVALQFSKKGFQEFLQDLQENPKKIAEQLTKPGKQVSVKELLKHGDGAKSMDISELGLGDFKSIAKKYGMEFAVVESRNLDPPQYTVFFRAKDTDIAEKVFQEYAAKKMQQKEAPERPSLRKALKKLREKVAGIPRKAVERWKQPER